MSWLHFRTSCRHSSGTNNLPLYKRVPLPSSFHPANIAVLCSAASSSWWSLYSSVSLIFFITCLYSGHCFAFFCASAICSYSNRLITDTGCLCSKNSGLSKTTFSLSDVTPFLRSSCLERRLGLPCDLLAQCSRQRLKWERKMDQRAWRQLSFWAVMKNSRFL